MRRYWWGELSPSPCTFAAEGEAVVLFDSICEDGISPRFVFREKNLPAVGVERGRGGEWVYCGEGSVAGLRGDEECCESREGITRGVRKCV